MSPSEEIIEQRLKQLEDHLQQENPVLLDAVKGFRDLDRVAQDMGLLAGTSPLQLRSPGGP